MECLNIDFLGPFPDKGYILVIVSTFTRWVELYLTTDSTALSAAEYLIKHFGRIGAPRQLRSDNDPHFIAAVINEFLTLVGVEQCLTLSYSKEENAIIERYNKEINRHLRALKFDNVSLGDYRKSLPFEFQSQRSTEDISIPNALWKYAKFEQRNFSKIS